MTFAVDWKLGFKSQWTKPLVRRLHHPESSEASPEVCGLKRTVTYMLESWTAVGSVHGHISFIGTRIRHSSAHLSSWAQDLEGR